MSEDERNSKILGKKIEVLTTSILKLVMITNRGVKVYPGGQADIYCTDYWRCRFVSADSSNQEIGHKTIIHLLRKLESIGLNFIKTGNLYYFNGERGYSGGQE